MERVIEQGQLVGIDDEAGRRHAGGVRHTAAEKPAIKTSPARQAPAGWIWIDVVDERGEAVATRFQLERPDGRQIDESLTAGNSISGKGLPPGTCRLVLPEIDRRCQRVKRLTPVQVIPGQIQYRPGQPLVLDTDRSYEVVIPAFRDLWMETPLDNADADAEDRSLHRHQFILRGSDGYRASATVDDDVTIDHDDLLTLTFANLYQGPTYDLISRRADGQQHVLFEAQPFDALFPRGCTDVGELDRLFHR
ncbi:MAG: hypothetical protein QOI66_5223 [Myxococcales bacterium]|nr:hypothetical protein [Myxococcales bacterium]